jgi:chemotaxis protein MotB
MVNELQEKLDKENAARTALESDVAKLEGEKAELIRVKESLFDANRELNFTIADISHEKLEAIKEKDRAIADISDKKMQAIKEKDRAIADLSDEKMQAIKEKDRAISELKKTYNNLVSELNEEIKKGEIEVTQLRDKLTLSMVDKILFDSGKADIKQNGKAVLDRVAEILKRVTDKQIRIEGHTDNVPIGPVLAVKFPTNWELSTARSTTVVRYLQYQGVDPAFLSAAGYSEYRPVDSNEEDEGRAKNRRIEIVLIPLDTEQITTE